MPQLSYNSLTRSDQQCVCGCPEGKHEDIFTSSCAIKMWRTLILLPSETTAQSVPPAYPFNMSLLFGQKYLMNRNNSRKWEFHPDWTINCLSTRGKCLSSRSGTTMASLECVCLMAKGRQIYEVQKKEKGTFYLGKVVKLCCFLK